MATERFYKPGSFYRIDDMSGFAVRAERTKRMWYGTYRADNNWEPRNAQDFVTGVRDDQTVPDPRPVAPPTFVAWPSNLKQDAQGNLILDPVTGMPIVLGP